MQPRKLREFKPKFPHLLNQMKFPFPFKSTDITITSTAASPWPWPSCATSPRTLSFRVAAAELATAAPRESAFPPHHYHESSELEVEAPSPESAVISGLRSERLFFDPEATSSIVEEGKKEEKESVAVVVLDSRNPLLDFRVSMEEMVEACGVRGDWEFLEELLEWYLRVNDETNHCYIVGAFVDLLVSAMDENASSSSSSSPSPSSSSASSPLSAATNFSFTSPFSFSSSS